ncbi:hypothetical protein GCM10022268_15710 [Sphingomonas cynarae]|uniref:HTH marR-type domain-containing protein n=1 Tax=Sphingomonas cynarae TaxID=930197 RepID=A0ABP7DNC6_9SPHN
MRETFDTVLVADPGGRAAMEEAITLAGGRIVDRLGWDELAMLDDRLGITPVLAVQAEGVRDDVIEAGLSLIADVAARSAPQIVVTLHHRQIDPVAAALLGPTVHLLCDEGTARLVAALAVAGLVAPAGLHDRVGEAGEDELRRLKDEIGRIAELLVRLAERGEPRPGGDEGNVGDRRMSFGFEPPAAPIDPQLVRQAIRARRLRDSFLGDGLFEDPAWDMLLDLYAAQLEGQRVSVSSLCIAAAVAPTTALRWIARLTEAGLFRRQPDATDRRRAFMALSSRGLAGMDAYMAAVRRAGLSIA